MRLEAGSRLGPYEIIGPIGAGGMGEVYRARDTRLGREVAVKVLPQQLTRDRERLARFEREARSASALNHRNIVTVHDFTSLDGESWLVMELVRGESLRSVISHGPLPLKKALQVASGIADGLWAAHAAGIVHRDLKPENVMVLTDGTAKILDFGLVKHAPASDQDSPTDLQVTRDGTILGTASYMSPEQARGGEVDFRTDHFSFGLLLHEMATGKHPFRRATQVEMLAAILNDDPQRLPDSLPHSFAWIVDRCLAKNPDDRYGSTSDLAHDLKRLRDGGDAHAKPATSAARPRWPLVAIGALAVALALALVLMTSRLRSARVASTSVEAAIPTPAVAQVYLDEVAAPVAISPNGRYLIVCGSDEGGTGGLWLHDLQAGTAKQIARNAFSAGWSADSRSIAFFADGKLKTMNVDGGPATTVCDARPEGTPTWRNDTILYTQYSTDAGIYRVSAAGGKPQRIVPPESNRRGLPWWPQFLPDGRHFLYMALLQGPEVGEIEHEVFVGSLDGTPRKLIPNVVSHAQFADGHLLFVRDGTLLAQPFDLDKLQMSGEARPVVNDLHYFRSTGLAAFSVSENGVLVWRTRTKPVRLAWLDRTGAESGTVATAPFGSGRLSPDGTRYVAGVVDPRLGVSDVWIYDLVRESSERVTFRKLDEKAPVWAPDGQTIYYRADGGGGPPDVFRWKPGDSAGELVHSGPRVEEPQDVSPDGEALLFGGQQSAGADLYVLPLIPPGPARPFVVTPFNETSSRFSPDGHSVAYTSDVSGRPEIYVRPYEGAAQPLRISREGGASPVWRRDGKELFYLAPGGKFMSVPIAADGRPGTARILFQAPTAVDYDVAVDGSKFLVQLKEELTEPPVRVLVNWPARIGQ